ncbi:MAG: hypothetical protein AAGM84_02115 [Pseudomonadota bacterium]
MKNVIATALAATLLAAPAFALPTNNTVAGGQGDVQLDGQITAAAFGLTGTVTAVAVVGAVLVVTIITDDGEEVTVTTTTTP